jgi:hypothetical protein
MNHLEQLLTSPRFRDPTVEKKPKGFIDCSQGAVSKNFLLTLDMGTVCHSPTLHLNNLVFWVVAMVHIVDPPDNDSENESKGPQIVSWFHMVLSGGEWRSCVSYKVEMNMVRKREMG